MTYTPFVNPMGTLSPELQLAMTGDGASDGLHYAKCPAGVDMKISVLPKATTSSPRCDAGFHILLVAN